MLDREVETKYSLATAVWLDRSLFSVLRRGDVSEDEHKEVQRREDEVEDRLEDWQERKEGGCASWFSKLEQGCGITVDF